MFRHGDNLEPTQLPASLGYEASGVVVGVGAGVSNEQIGKIVLTVD
jgi:NADPH:quinone reductase-like Zn-dependent oxidoreductase